MKGGISINRRNDGNIVLRIADSLSGRDAIEVVMTPETLGEALTGASRIPIDYELLNSDRVGKKREVMRVDLPEKKGEEPKLPKRLANAGWEYSSGWKNHHCSKTVDGVTYYVCTLLRYVEVEDDGGS